MRETNSCSRLILHETRLGFADYTGQEYNLAKTSMLRRDLLKLAAGAVIPDNKKQRSSTSPAARGSSTPSVRRAGRALSHSEKVLIEMGKRAGFEVECTKDGRVFDGDLDQYDVIAFYTSGDLTGAGQGRRPPMTPAGKRRLLDAIAAGKGFVGFHSATDTFHSKGEPTDRDPYIAMLGGEFVTHGAQQEASLVAHLARFPARSDLGMARGARRSPTNGTR